MTGRIGVGKRVHRIMTYAVPSRWGVARCGGAGDVTLVPEGVVSCLACVRRNGAPPAGGHEAHEGHEATRSES